MRCSILCPIDFSSGSKGALRYAIALASHFDTELTLVHVADPLLTAAIETRAGPSWRQSDEDALRDLLSDVCGTAPPPPHVHVIVSVGKPAVEIRQAAAQCRADLIVMSSHGFRGPRKWILGSTTERMLRETATPVLVTPPSDPGEVAFNKLARSAHAVMAPVDFGASTEYQTGVAALVAAAFGVPMILAHVIPPLAAVIPPALRMADIDIERANTAEHAIRKLAAGLPPGVVSKTVVAFGEPPDQIASLALAGHAGLIVMGLHESTLLGPRMGSVTYRTLCAASGLVLALPPAPPADAIISALTRMAAGKA